MKARLSDVRCILLVLILGLTFALGATPSASAHPGRTDANGGHTCRTNCPSWGLNYGEYHYHNGNSAPVPDPEPEQDVEPVDPDPVVEDQPATSDLTDYPENDSTNNSATSSPCPTRTALMGSSLQGDISLFRRFRDQKLNTSPTGRLLVRLYYVSAPMTDAIVKSNPIVKLVFRETELRPIAILVRYTN